VSAAGRSRRSWGWHPLVDEWAARVVAAAGIRPGELVLDIGAGDGALTGPLVACGARVIAVELHPGRAARLRARFAGGPVTVVAADAATLRLPRPLTSRRSDAPSSAARRGGPDGAAPLPFAPAFVLPARPFRVVASPPYALSSQVLRTLLAPGSPLVGADLVLQRAVVRRYVDAARGRRWELRAGLSLPRRAFRPPPQVDSAVLVVRRR
jgi:23S rRNA (adenine-N6)-dimethyltransferase